MSLISTYLFVGCVEENYNVANVLSFIYERYNYIVYSKHI